MRYQKSLVSVLITKLKYCAGERTDPKKKNQIIPSSTQCIDVLCNVNTETEQSMECNIKVNEIIQRHQRHDFICQHRHINNNTHVQTQTGWLDLLCFAFLLLSSESKLTVHVAFWDDLHCNYGNTSVNAHIDTRKTNSNNINSKSGTWQKHHFTHTDKHTHQTVWFSHTKTQTNTSELLWRAKELQNRYHSNFAT